MKVNEEHQPANKNVTEETYGGHKIKKGPHRRSDP